MDTSTTTELGAVNAMLATIGEAPLNTLVDATVPDAFTAVSCLREVLREVLVEGWEFNTDLLFPLMPDGYSPWEIHVPATAISVRPTPEFVHIVWRGTRLYDRTAQSYSFPNTPKVICEVVWHLPFEELPEVTRQYVTIRASRLFQSRVPGVEPMSTITHERELAARKIHRKANVKVTRKSYLMDSLSVRRIHTRSGG